MAWMDSLKDAAKARGELPTPERDRIAKDLVMMSAMGSAVVTLAPIPLSDFVLVTPVQASMVMAVARVYGRELSLSESKHVLLELGSVCGLAYLSQKGFATVSKLLLPGLGGVLAAPYSFAITYAMGRVAMSYFRDKDASRDRLRSIFNDAKKEARGLFSRERLERFRRKRGREVQDFAQDEASPRERRRTGQA